MKELDHERFFEPFIDEVDGVACVPAFYADADITRIASPLGWRFPLILDAEAPLSAQVAASFSAPSSSRFGPYCDNIVGMNWELPDRRRVRVGERVVKSTTGYDIFRFLLATDGRFGRATEYVLRLRPACDGGGIVFFDGPQDSLESAAAELMHSCYIHWLESMDWLTTGPKSGRLRFGIHCPQDEWPLFLMHLDGIAKGRGLLTTVTTGNGQVFDGLPDLVLKTTPDRVISLARETAEYPGVRSIALCAPAVVHVYLPSGAEAATIVKGMVGALADSLYSLGGGWQSRRLECPLFGADEAEWIKSLAKEWGLAA
jgi:FAD/FMN-containing dehydrogenase